MWVRGGLRRRRTKNAERGSGQGCKVARPRARPLSWQLAGCPLRLLGAPPQLAAARRIGRRQHHAAWYRAPSLFPVPTPALPSAFRPRWPSCAAVLRVPALALQPRRHSSLCSARPRTRHRVQSAAGSPAHRRRTVAGNTRPRKKGSPWAAGAAATSHTRGSTALRASQQSQSHLLSSSPPAHEHRRGPFPQRHEVGASCSDGFCGNAARRRCTGTSAAARRLRPAAAHWPQCCRLANASSTQPPSLTLSVRRTLLQPAAVACIESWRRIPFL